MISGKVLLVLNAPHEMNIMLDYCLIFRTFDVEQGLIGVNNGLERNIKKYWLVECHVYTLKLRKKSLLRHLLNIDLCAF